MAARGLLQTVVWLVVLAAILFGAGGGWDWPEAWAYLALSAVSALLIGVWLQRHDPALLEARLSRFHRDQEPWDRLFLALGVPAFVLWLVLIALDARRFGWSRVPLWTQISGAILIALCMVLVWRVFRANRFAAPQVRLQAEQRVVTEGPYRVVRHPMYAAALLYFLGVPLLLGSWWGLLVVPLFTTALGLRAMGEERMLRQALPGYNDYASHTRSRLIPYIW
ncbi:MAG TPA: isoprenylcysteine carboxylmethyltransferase family protein [Rhodopila sp.]